MEEKIKQAKELIDYILKSHPRVAVACSFGKDSIVTVHLLARGVDDTQEYGGQNRPDCSQK